MSELGVREGDPSTETKLKRQKIREDEKIGLSTSASDPLISELLEESALQEGIVKASETFVQENTIYNNSNTFLNSILFPEITQNCLANFSGKNKLSNSENECQLQPELNESDVRFLNGKESRVQAEKHYTKDNIWKYIRISIPQAPFQFSCHNQQPDISDKKINTYLPEETKSQLLKTRYGHFVITFVERYGRVWPEIVYLDIILKIVPLTESILFPNASLGLQACASATILIGAFQEGCLDQVLWNTWGNMMRACAESFGEMHTVEILYAHILMIMLSHITHDWDHFLKHSNLIADLFPKVPNVPTSFLTCVRFFALMKIYEFDSTKTLQYQWKIILDDLQSFPESSSRYPNLMSTAMLNNMKMDAISWDGQKKYILKSFAKEHSIFSHCVTFELLYDWMLAVAINPSLSSSYKSDIICEMVCYFEECAFRWDCPFSKLQPMFQFLINEAQLFFMLAAGRLEEAKTLIRIEIEKLQNDPTVVSSLALFKTVHRFHFFCMALSVTQMSEEYTKFEKVINKYLAHLELPLLPVYPPASIVDLCQEPLCYQIWNLVSCTDIPDFIHNTIDFTPCEVILCNRGKIST